MPTTTIHEWINNYNKLGIQSLKNKSKISGNAKLSKEQINEIKNILKEHTPDKLGYDERFWSVSCVKRLVNDRYQVVYKSTQSYRNLLSLCGFSYHKPSVVNRKRDSHMVKRFEEKLKKSSKNTTEKIVWYW